MPHKTMPDSLATVALYAWLGAIAVWGYVADFMVRLKLNKVRPPIWWTFILDAPGALFFSFVAYALARAANASDWVSIAAVGLAAHYGSRGLYMIEAMVISIAQRRVEYMVEETERTEDYENRKEQ